VTTVNGELDPTLEKPDPSISNFSEKNLIYLFAFLQNAGLVLYIPYLVMGTILESLTSLRGWLMHAIYLHTVHTTI
jgi:hypothetical protein